MNQIQDLLLNLSLLVKPSNIIDILIVAFVVYKIIGWITDTQAEQVAKGVVILLLATQLSEWFRLYTVNFLLRNLMTVGFIALVIVFQPELRRALEHIGRTSFFKTKWMENVNETKRTIEEIVEAVQQMSNSKTGALIALEKDTGLEDIISTGTRLDSAVSSELLLNIFTPNTPLHDGAVIISIRENKLKAASCLLPLTENKNVSKTLGTRHRAAMGMSENSDAIILIVSEESGVISYANTGKIYRYLDANALQEFLTEEFIVKDEKSIKIKFWGTQNNEKNKQGE
ncbi:diadenylate cyclase CdaA [Alkalibacter rhizosphaerae]|uniref:Diadenylate cyclase n=1 Tax=Alkalibacter rhizosphaerae TaxID=2815577 RepID=A0A974XDM7_9FIRM|nr:diadenylate cyclase CdaA [Alkalibacter rhizosphaerae]QSX07904.1 diadenylate cyclase CdaA [Alkalibacter rhizosphaerae]